MNKRILVVDDERGIRELYKQELEDQGYAVETASNTNEADEIIGNTAVDLMILDIKLGKDDGLSYLRKTMENHSDLPVIISSAYGSYKDDFSSWLAEAYIVKSSDLDPLKQKVEEILAD